MNKNDPQALIFTLKNPHGVGPTRFLKKRESMEAIRCNPICGPVFGNTYSDIGIRDHCNEEQSCFVNTPNVMQYEYHPQYKSSLYVNTNSPNDVNYFSILDYEVFAVDM